MDDIHFHDDDNINGFKNGAVGKNAVGQNADGKNAISRNAVGGNPCLKYFHFFFQDSRRETRQDSRRETRPPVSSGNSFIKIMNVFVNVSWIDE